MLLFFFRLKNSILARIQKVKKNELLLATILLFDISSDRQTDREMLLSGLV